MAALHGGLGRASHRHLLKCGPAAHGIGPGDVSGWWKDVLGDKAYLGGRGSSHRAKLRWEEAVNGTLGILRPQVRQAPGGQAGTAVSTVPVAAASSRPAERGLLDLAL